MNGVNSLFSKLLSPGQLGPLEVRNRIVLPAIDHNNCNEEGLITDETVAHYETRAKGGVGLLIVETSAVSYPHGATARRQPALSDDKALPGLSRTDPTRKASASKSLAS